MPETMPAQEPHEHYKKPSKNDKEPPELDELVKIQKILAEHERDKDRSKSSAIHDAMWEGVSDENMAKALDIPLDEYKATKKRLADRDEMLKTYFR